MRSRAAKLFISQELKINVGTIPWFCVVSFILFLFASLSHLYHHNHFIQYWCLNLYQWCFDLCLCLYIYILAEEIIRTCYFSKISIQQHYLSLSDFVSLSQVSFNTVTFWTTLQVLLCLHISTHKKK